MYNDIGMIDICGHIDMTSELAVMMAAHELWVFDEEGGKRMDIKALPNKDASGQRLPHAYLQRANLSGINLTSADFNYGQFQGAVLVRAIMIECALKGADLSKANLNGADLTNADMRWCKLDNALLRRTNMQGVNLDGADLSKVDLSQALNVPRKYW